jgi:hypothetical protein
MVLNIMCDANIQDLSRTQNKTKRIVNKYKSYFYKGMISIIYSSITDIDMSLDMPLDMPLDIPIKYINVYNDGRLLCINNSIDIDSIKTYVTAYSIGMIDGIIVSMYPIDINYISCEYDIGTIMYKLYWIGTLSGFKYQNSVNKK